MTLKLDLNGNPTGVDNSGTVGLGGQFYTSLFADAVLKPSSVTGSVSEIILSNVEAGLKLGFTSYGLSSILGGLFSVVNEGHGFWAILSNSPSTLTTADWTLALDSLQVHASMGAQQGLDSIGVMVIGACGFTTATEDLHVTCFYRGTLVRTPAGEVAVETLKHGDLVLTHDGREVPVAWLGRQTVSTVFADKLRVLPIRIKAGALGENVPARDLLVSPDHAMFVEGVLIHAGALVNGTSVVRETNVPTIYTYFHVEVADHSLILAEGAPAETFVDNVDRLGFDNWNEYEALYPQGKTVEEMPYPRAKSRRQVPVSIRVALAARAEAIGAVAELSAVA